MNQVIKKNIKILKASIKQAKKVKTFGLQKIYK